MHVGVKYGSKCLELDIPEDRLVGVRRGQFPPHLSDPAAAVQAALEKPSGFPALRQALTPDDHVVVIVDEHLPHLPQLLVPVMEHVVSAHVWPNNIAIVCPPGASTDWVVELPGEFRKLRVEVHEPTDRLHLSYLATTRKGRRIYLNRSAVDADQLVVISRRGFDPLLGYSGSEGAIYPALSNEATRKEMFGRLSLSVPGIKTWPVRKEAAEVAWLLGTPFMVQVIEGVGNEIAHVIGGVSESGEEGIRLLNAGWRIAVDSLADLVVVGLGADAERQTFADLARALACAARVVKPEGRIVLLSEADPLLGPGAELLCETENPTDALGLLGESFPVDAAAAFQWASAAQRASIYLLSKLPGETAESLFATPLDHAGQVERLLRTASTQLFISDAHKTLAEAPAG